jgi:GMP synthase (glutamine-hydrolysing)
MKDKQTIIVLDFGGQYKDLIARRVRELGVYSIILSGDTTTKEILSYNPIGIITTGGPKSVYKTDSSLCDKELLQSGIPILGICYGMQMMAYVQGGTVESASVSEYGQTSGTVISESPLFEKVGNELKVLMSHTDRITKIPEGFTVTAYTNDCPIAAMKNKEKIFMVFIHPEVTHTLKERQLYEISCIIYVAKGDYNMKNYIETAIGR